MAKTPSDSNRGRRRIAFFDMLRGFTIVSMVLFHAAYDAAYLYGFDMPWFQGTLFQDIWRASISWTFLALAGWMTTLSRSNFKRAALYGAAALVVWIATSVASVDTAVSFGILFCMAASTLICAVAKPVLDRMNPMADALVFLGLFVLTLDVPHRLYPVGGLAWLGFPGPGFSSGDYYPIIPFTFMYLFGAMAARSHTRCAGAEYPAWMYVNALPPLSAIGRLSLPIYLLHQPLLLVLFELLCS